MNWPEYGFLQGEMNGVISVTPQEHKALTVSVSQEAHEAHAMGTRRSSVPTILHNGAMYRNGIVQLMVQPLAMLDEC